MHAHPLLPEPEMAQDALDDILLVDDAKRCAFAGSGEATPVGLSFAQAISLRSIPVSTSGTQRVGLPHLLDQLAQSASWVSCSAKATFSPW